MSIRAIAPPAPPPPFARPKIHECNRSGGHVQVPDPDTESEGPLAMSWKIASAGVLMDDNHAHPPPKLRRTSSVAGNVLVINLPENPAETNKRAVWLQRKVHEEAHTNSYVRIGFPLAPILCEGEIMAGAWEVKKADKGHMYPFEIVAVKVKDYGHVFRGNDEAKTEGDSEKLVHSRNALNEISALQMIRTADPQGKGNVVFAEIVASDDVQVYTIMPLCKEGSLMDLIGASGGDGGRLEEGIARRYFGQILNGLTTLQKVKICHRNLSLETILMRGDECHLSSLGWCLRVPTTEGEDGEEVHLLEPQLTCGRKPQFVAPEVFRGDPFDGFAVDLWAAGVILYQMLLGADSLFSAPIPEDPKFYEMCVHGQMKSVVEKMEALRLSSCEDPSEGSGLKPVSSEALELLQGLFRSDPADRMTLHQVKEHPWMKAQSPAAANSST